ncbi:MAG: hypothetical protein WA741_32045 [Candidatus Sulfotelmatobacter sp.]
MRCCGNAGYNLANCTDVDEVIETLKVIAEGHVQSWYAARKATADRGLALADRTQDFLGKGGTYMRGSTCERMAEFLLPPDDPKRPGSFEKTGSSFFKGFGTLGLRNSKAARRVCGV